MLKSQLHLKYAKRVIKLLEIPQKEKNKHRNPFKMSNSSVSRFASMD